MRKINRIITLSILVTMISSFSFGCGNDTPGGNETTEATEIPTTTKVEDTTVQTETPTTNSEPTTTEEPTTKYVKKGLSIIVDKKNAEHFNGLVIESGYTFYINEFIVNPEHMQARGNTANALLNFLGFDTTQFEAKYFPLGYQAPEIPYDDNYSFTYTGDKKYTFTYMYEKDNGYVYFDFHEVK